MAKSREISDKQHKSGKVKIKPAAMEWEDVFQAIGHPSFILEPDHTIVACNKAVAELTGKPEEDFIRKKCYEVFHEKDKPPENCPAVTLLETGRFETVEMEMEALGKTFLVSCTPVLDEKGTLGRIIHIATDITKRKEIEQKLREGETKFRTLFESGAEGIIVARVKDRKFKYANPAFCLMLGYTQEELSTMRLEDIHPDESLKELIRRFDSHDKGEIRSMVDVPCLRKDGTLIYAHITATREIIDGDICNIGFFYDSTNLRQIRLQLQIERDRAQKYLDIAGVMLVVLDTTGTVQLINKKGCEILGRDEAQIIGKNWFDSFLPDDTREDVRTVFIQLMSGEIEPAEYFENPVLRRDGEKRIIAWHNTILRDEKGNITGTLSSGEDITERKRAEEKLRENQRRLKALSAELSYAEERERRRIAMGIHDNLSQKLAMAKLNLEVLKESVSEQSVRDAIDSECEILADMIEDTRSLTFELSNPILYEIGLEWAVKNLIETDFSKRGKPNCILTFGGDTTGLSEDAKVVLFKAVRELLINVVKHAKADTIKVNIANHDTEIVITVKDDGVGFEAGKLGLPSSAKGGFGLFNIRERLEYIGGRMAIETQPGKGTRIVMTIPVKKSEPGRKRIKQHEGAGRR